MVPRRSGTGIFIKGNPQLLKRIFNQEVVFIYYILWRYSFFLGADGNGNPMLIGTADESNFAPLSPVKTRIHICRNIHSCKMADMHRAVGIGKGCRNNLLLRHAF